MTGMREPASKVTKFDSTVRALLIVALGVGLGVLFAPDVLEWWDNQGVVTSVPVDRDEESVGEALHQATVVKGSPRPTRNEWWLSPPFLLHEAKEFTFFATSGTCCILKQGEFVREIGRMDISYFGKRLLIFEEDRATIVGAHNTETQVVRNANSVSVTATNKRGKRVLTIYDEWIPSQRGFKATYDITFDCYYDQVISGSYSGYACQNGDVLNELNKRRLEIKKRSLRWRRRFRH